MIRKFRHALFPLALFLAALACNRPLSLSGQPRVQPPDSSTLDLDLAASVARLEDESSRQAGVWSLLHNLGIGVYRGDGSQLMAGSETGADDFWLYDFEVPLLEEMAGRQPRPFQLTHTRLEQVGYPGSVEDLRALADGAYRSQPDNAVARYFSASGVSFEQQPDLTRLQEWVFLLDALVRPNGDVRTAATGQLRFPAQAGGSCGTISGGVILPAWGVVRSASDSLALLNAEDMYVSLHGALLMSSLESDLSASATEVHEGHGGPGDRSTLTAHVNMNYEPQDIPVAGVSCGVLVNLDPPIVGPVSGANVFWQVAGALPAHGHLDLPASGVTSTDINGDSTVVYQAQLEAANGDGELRSATGTVKASVDLRQILMERSGEITPRLYTLLPERMPVGTGQDISIGWHQKEPENEIPDGEWAGTIAVGGDIDYSDLSTTSVSSGPITFTVSAGEVDGTWKMSGTAETSMENGHGTATFTNQGMVSGTSKSPTVAFTHAHIEQRITVTIDDVTVPYSDSRDIEGDGEISDLPLDDVSCDQVIGRWTFSPVSYYSGSGWYVATRVDGVSEEQTAAYQESLEELLVQAEAVRATTEETGVIEFIRLDALLSQARALNDSLERSLECGDAEPSRFTSPLRGLLADLVDFALEHPDSIDAIGLHRLADAAHETGALPPLGSADIDDAERIAEFSELIRQQAEDAADEADCESLGLLRSAAGAVGDASLSDDVNAIWAASCG